MLNQINDPGSTSTKQRTSIGRNKVGNKGTYIRTRRSKKKKPLGCTFFYNNINGLRSKIYSLTEIIRNLEPELIALCETKVASLNMIQKHMSGYNIIARNLKAGKGGLLITSKKQSLEMLDVTSTPTQNILVARINLGKNPIRIMLTYSPQEGDKLEVREEFYMELELAVLNCKAAGDLLMILGDFNTKLKRDDQQNITPVSGNGYLLVNMVEGNNMKILNFSEKCDRKWTHMIRTTGQCSTLDYAITDETVEKCVSKVTIDETGVYCPFHISRKNGQDVMKFTDHNPIIVQLMIQGETPRSKEKKRYNWKLTGKSLAKWRELTDTQPGPIGSNISLPTDYDKFELVLNKLMSKCFIKSKINKQKESSPRIDKSIVKTIMQFGKKGKRERKISRLYKERCIKENAKEVADKRLERIKIVILTMTEEERFSAQGFGN